VVQEPDCLTGTRRGNGLVKLLVHVVAALVDTTLTCIYYQTDKFFLRLPYDVMTIGKYVRTVCFMSQLTDVA